MGSSLIAQNRHTEQADKLYNRLEYVDAAKEYHKLVDKNRADGYVYKQLADSYYNVFNSEQAVIWYAKALETPQDAETHFRYAQMLKAQGQYEKANAQMQTFAQMAPQDQRAIIFKQDPNYLPKLRQQAKLYDEKLLSVNSDQSDFGAVLSNDNYLYFASARNQSRKTYGWNDEPFLDLYQSVHNADGSFSEATAVSGVNTRFHEGPATISADGNTMYFSSESFKEGDFERDRKNKLKKGQLYLYKATKEGQSWGNVTELPLNNKDFSNSNPSLSADGKTLYFSSNRPGSKGGFDIFRVSINADGSFGEPENLGDKVNTEGNEGFPFISDEGVLYFSSDARAGFGGLDIFMIDLKNNGQATNLGAPVNSSKDDFAFSFNQQKNLGFFSSNRAGKDNIYQAIPVCSTPINVTVKDALTMAVLSNAKVSILDDRNNIIETRTSDANGIVKYTVDCGRTFTIQASKEGYEAKSFPVAQTKGTALEVSAELQPIESIIKPDEITLNEIYFEFDKSNITKEGAFELDKLVQAMQKYPELVIMVKAHTDKRGSDAYNMALSERRARSTVQYVLSKGIARDRIQGKGFGESEPKVDCEPCTEEQHQQNRRSEFLIVKQ